MGTEGRRVINMGAYIGQLDQVHVTQTPMNPRRRCEN